MVFFLRLLNSSPEQTESDSRRIGGLLFDKATTTRGIFADGDNQARQENSRIHRDEQQDKPALMSRPLASCGSGREASLKSLGEVRQEVKTGQGGEGHLIPAEKDSQCHSPPWTGQDSELSIKGDEVDSSAWSICSKAGQKASKDPTVGRSPGSTKSAGSDSSICDTPGDKGTTGLNMKVSSREDNMEAREGLTPGGGAFIQFRREPKQTLTPTRHMTMVC